MIDILPAGTYYILGDIRDWDRQCNAFRPRYRDALEDLLVNGFGFGHVPEHNCYIQLTGDYDSCRVNFYRKGQMDYSEIFDTINCRLLVIPACMVKVSEMKQLVQEKVALCHTFPAPLECSEWHAPGDSDTGRLTIRSGSDVLTVEFGHSDRMVALDLSPSTYTGGKGKGKRKH